MGVAKPARVGLGEKRGLLVTYGVLSLLLLAPLAAWSQASPPWVPWQNPYGICTHQTTPEALRVIKAAGIGWIRIDMHWRDIEPREPGRFEWGAVDAVVQGAREQQLKIYATVGGTPAWAADPHIPPDTDRDTYHVPPGLGGLDELSARPGQALQGRYSDLRVME